MCDNLLMKFQLFFMDEILVFVMIECSVTSCMGSLKCAFVCECGCA